MPSRKLPDGTHKDMVHPIKQEFRQYLEENILKAYADELAKHPITQTAQAAPEGQATGAK